MSGTQKSQFYYPHAASHIVGTREYLAEDGKMAFILRLNSDESESKLFVRRWMYVGLRRSWSKGSRILFASKLNTFLGYGVVEKVLPLGELDEDERDMCLQSNWSSKLYFVSLAKFNPPLAISATPAAVKNPIILHGSAISESVAVKIEELSDAKIVT